MKKIYDYKAALKRKKIHVGSRSNRMLRMCIQNTFFGTLFSPESKKLDIAAQGGENTGDPLPLETEEEAEKRQKRSRTKNINSITTNNKITIRISTIKRW